MIQGGSSLRFALEAGQGLLIFGNFVRQELQRNKAAKLYVLSFVNHTHPSPAELIDDAVVRDGFSNHGVQGAMLWM
jgi:hypothetical protein